MQYRFTYIIIIFIIIIFLIHAIAFTMQFSMPAIRIQNTTSCYYSLTASDQPVHLYDAYTGVIRASYRPYNALDELESPQVVRFAPDGQFLATAGFRTDRTVLLFDTAIPGRTPSNTLRLGKTRRSSDGQKGLVSAICFHSTSNAADRSLLAVGTYSPGSIYLYDLRAPGNLPSGTILQGLCVVGHGKGHSLRKKRRFVETAAVTETATNDSHNDSDGHNDTTWFSDAKARWFRSKAQGGVTQLEFANDSSSSQNYILYSTSRRSNCVLAWDLRMLSGNPDYQSHPIRGLASYATHNETNQRIEFDTDADTLYVGNTDGSVRQYDLSSGKCTGHIAITCDGAEANSNRDDNVQDKGTTAVVAVNGVSHARLPNGDAYLAVATGSRQFPSEDDLERGTISTKSTAGHLYLYKRNECRMTNDAKTELLEP